MESSEREAPIFGLYKRLFTLGGMYFRTDVGRLLHAVPMMMFCLNVLMVLLYSLYVYLYEIEKLAVIVHHTILIIDIMVSIVVTYSKKELVNRLVSDMTKTYNYHSPLVNKFVRSLQSERIKTLKQAYKVVMISIVILIGNLTLNALFEPYIRQVEHVLMFPCWFPFSLDYMPYHIMALIWQFAALFALDLNAFALMAFLFCVYSHMKCQIELLMYSLEQIQERASELTSRQTEMKSTTKQNQILKQDWRKNHEKTVRRSYIICTKQCAQHHMEIIAFFHRADELARIIYTVLFITGLGLFICTGFTLISNNTSLKLKFVVITTIQLIFLYITSWFGEQISDLSSKIRFSIYALAWYEMPRECQTTLILMTEGTLRPLQFTLLTGHKVNLEGYMSMLKASYSYFNMLLASQRK